MAEVTTARILADKALQELHGKECVDWAASMLAAGHDGEYLAILAGESPPFNHFEMVDFRDRALAEVGAPGLDTDDAIQAYAVERLALALGGEADLAETLHEVADLYVASGYPSALQDIYLLHFAQAALCESPNQWYWEGATRENIDEIIQEHVRAVVSQPTGAA